MQHAQVSTGNRIQFGPWGFGSRGAIRTQDALQAIIFSRMQAHASFNRRGDSSSLDLIVLPTLKPYSLVEWEWF